MFAELLSAVILLFQTLNPFFKRGIFFIFLFEKTLVEFGDFINRIKAVGGGILSFITRNGHWAVFIVMHIICDILKYYRRCICLLYTSDAADD